MPSAIIYAAKSTQDRKDSIGTQLAECREMADAEDWTVVAEYQDENFSAYSGNRGPGLADAREHAARLASELGEVVYLIAQAHDRFARGAGDRPGAPESLGEIWHATRRQNVHLRTVEDDDELRDEAAVAAIGRRAHIDSARKSKSVTKGMKRRRELGEHTGGTVYGYDRDPVKGLKPNPAQAAVVKRIFLMVAAGVSQAEVARTLNREGVPTARAGARWQQGTMARILRSRTYLGELPADRSADRAHRNFPEQWRMGKHDAIIDEALWQDANAARERAAALRGRGGGPRPKAGHLLPGRLLQHGACGCALTPRADYQRKDGTVTARYTCSGRKAGQCAGLIVPMEDLDGAVIDYLADVVIDVPASVEAAQAATATERDARAAELATARAASAKAAKRSAEIRADYLAGKISADDWNDLRAALDTDRAAADARVREIESAEVAPVEAVAQVTTALDLLKTARAAGDSAAILAAIDTLFVKFVVGDLPRHLEAEVNAGGSPTATPEQVRAARQNIAAKIAATEARAGRTVAEANAGAAPDDDAPAVRDEVTTAAGLTVLPIPHEAVVAVREDGRPAFGAIALRRA